MGIYSEMCVINQRKENTIGDAGSKKTEANDSTHWNTTREAFRRGTVSISRGPQCKFGRVNSWVGARL